MKIIKIHFLFLMLLSFANLNAQEKEENLKSGFITFNLTSPIFSYAPRWDIGYYKTLNQRFIVGIEAGYGNYNSTINFATDNDILTEDYKLFEIRPEVIYIINPERKTKKFFSGEVYFIHHTDAFTTSRFSEGNREFFFESADYRRIKYGFNLNYGMIINFTKNFGMIPKLGMGLRFRSVKYLDIIGKSERFNDDEGEGFPNIDGFIQHSGHQMGFNFVFDIKLFFRI